MKVAILATLVASAFASCATTQGSCQIQSDPWISTFEGGHYSFDKAGSFLALDADDMKVQIDVVQSDGIYGATYVTSKVTYTCGSEKQTFAAGGDLSEHVLVCTEGTCKDTICKVVLGRGYDPVDNVQIQQILYMGSAGNGAVDNETKTKTNTYHAQSTAAYDSLENGGYAASAHTSGYAPATNIYSSGTVSRWASTVAAIAVLLL
ncbi:hypothetical protein BDR26DRAFT_921065 [Obelidium mucronatum]|nr:hypothetical protein BDR26DRAFT_921065 [Obelidium mucronatum]